jgi:hypothetical protein
MTGACITFYCSELIQLKHSRCCIYSHIVVFCVIILFYHMVSGHKLLEVSALAALDKKLGILGKCKVHLLIFLS